MANKTTKDADKTVTEVDAAISRTEAFIDKNRNYLLWGAIALVAVVVIGSIWNWYVGSRDEMAQKEIAEGQFLFDEQNYEEALDVFESIVDSYGSTRTGNLAKAYVGLCKKELKDYDGAIASLKAYSGSDMLLAPAIESALGDCYVEIDDYAAAAKCFEKAAAAADNEAYSPLYLKKAGLAYEKAGDKAAALKAYTAIKDQWMQTAIGREVDKYIYRAGH